MLEVAAGRRGRVVHARGARRARVGRAADPFTNTVRMTVMTLRRKLGDPPLDRDGARERLPRVSAPAARPPDRALRGLFAVLVALLLAASRYWLWPATSTAPCPPAAGRAPRSPSSAASTCSRSAGRRCVATRAGLGAGRAASSRSMTDAFDAQRRFVANASHELRSPLTVIRTEAEVTLADPDAGATSCARWAAGVLERRRRDRGAAGRADGARAERSGRWRGASRVDLAARRGGGRAAPCARGGDRRAARPRARARARRAPAARAARREPGRERRPLQPPGRLRRRPHDAPRTAARCCAWSTAARRSTRRAPARLLEPFERGGRAPTAAARPRALDRALGRRGARRAGRARGARRRAAWRSTWCCRSPSRASPRQRPRATVSAASSARRRKARSPPMVSIAKPSGAKRGTSWASRQCSPHSRSLRRRPPARARSRRARAGAPAAAWAAGRAKREIRRADVDAVEPRRGGDRLGRLEPRARLDHHEAERRLGAPLPLAPRSTPDGAQALRGVAARGDGLGGLLRGLHHRDDDAQRAEVERVADDPRVVAATRTSAAAPPSRIACSMATIAVGSTAPCCWSTTT